MYCHYTSSPTVHTKLLTILYGEHVEIFQCLIIRSFTTMQHQPLLLVCHQPRVTSRWWFVCLLDGRPLEGLQVQHPQGIAKFAIHLFPSENIQAIMHHSTGSTKHLHRSFTRGGAALPLEGGGIQDLHWREANWPTIGVTATNQIGASLVLDKGMTTSWLRLIARGRRSSVGGGHGELRGGGVQVHDWGEEERHRHSHWPSLVCCTM